MNEAPKKGVVMDQNRNQTRTKPSRSPILSSAASLMAHLGSRILPTGSF